MIIRIGIFILAVLAVQPLRANPLARATYMNTAYCAGIAEAYGEKLETSSSWSHRGKAKDAKRVSERLARLAANFGKRSGFSQSQGAQATAQGKRTMASLLPANGAWASGGEIPTEAFRQYQHCATLAEL
jgi:hypothetical protein